MSPHLLIFDPPAFWIPTFIYYSKYFFLMLQEEQFFTGLRFCFFSCSSKVYIGFIIEPFLSTLREGSYLEWSTVALVDGYTLHTKDATYLKSE